MVNDKGIATCLDAKTGRPIWRERLDGDFTASPVSDGRLIAFANESGKTFVIEAADQFKLVSVNKLDAGCLASSALVEDSLILRTRTHLYCITD
jgi:outer membrane protein assembly factor BamB